MPSVLYIGGAKIYDYIFYLFQSVPPKLILSPLLPTNTGSVAVISNFWNIHFSPLAQHDICINYIVMRFLTYARRTETSQKLQKR